MTTDASLKTTVRDGVALRYLDAGAGVPPLMFLHGWCCDHTYWRDQTPAFSHSHRVVAVDLRGHGQSDKPDQDYTIDGFVDDTLWLMQEIGLERPVIIGHSMGGVIGLNLVRKHPGLARGLVMVDAPVVPLPEALAPMLASTLAALKLPEYAETARNFVATFMFRGDSDPELKRSILETMASTPQRVMWTALGNTVAPPNLTPGPVGLPALFLRASTQIAPAEEIMHRYPDLRVVEFDAAHFLQMEKPDQFNATLREFLETMP